MMKALIIGSIALAAVFAEANSNLIYGAEHLEYKSNGVVQVTKPFAINPADRTQSKRYFIPESPAKYICPWLELLPLENPTSKQEVRFEEAKDVFLIWATNQYPLSYILTDKNEIPKPGSVREASDIPPYHKFLNMFKTQHLVQTIFCLNPLEQGQQTIQIPKAEIRTIEDKTEILNPVIGERPINKNTDAGTVCKLFKFEKAVDKPVEKLANSPSLILDEKGRPKQMIPQGNIIDSVHCI